MRHHLIAAADFDSLARGRNTTGDVLSRSQLSTRLLLLHLVRTEAVAREPDLAEQVGLDHAATVLNAARRAGRPAVNRFLLHPQIGIWAMECLRRLRTGLPAEPVLAHFGAVAVVAALAARHEARVDVRIDDAGHLHLPTLGRLELDQGARRATVEVPPDGPCLSVTDGGQRLTVPLDPRWVPVRRLTSEADGSQIDFLLDDLDPYRCPPDLVPAGHLSEPEVDHWRACLDGAWRLLVIHHPDLFAPLAEGLMMATPLRPPEDGDEMSASTAEGYGAIAMTTPADGYALASAFVHEFQHSKLSAVLNLVALFENDSDALFYAPWRPDPRPLHGLFQGAYAYLGLIQFWERHRRRGTGREATVAEYEFALWREGVHRAIGTIERSGLLTPAGERFVGGMRATVDALLARPVAAKPAALARETAAETWIGWRLRNLTPSPGQVQPRAAAWCAGDPSPPAPPAAPPQPGRRTAAPRGRAGLRKLLLVEPQRFAGAGPDPVGLARLVSGATPADAAFVAGDDSTAVRLWRGAIMESPANEDAWTGLALASWRHPATAADALVERPELVRAVVEQIATQTGEVPDPGAVAGWLSTPRS